MEQSFSESTNDTDSEEVPVVATYLIIVLGLISTIIVITLDVMVINVIRWTRELHTKYFFLVAHLLGTDVAGIIVRFFRQCLIIILYQLDLNSDSTTIILKWLLISSSLLLYLMAILLPITIVVERMIVITFPFRHRSIMTTKAVAGMLATMWGLSTILTIIIIAIVPVDIVWPLGSVFWHPRIYPFMIVPRLTSAVSVIVANAFLKYKITISNRKAKENERLGNEEEVKKSKKLLRELRAQAKSTITLFIVGGIDVVANMLLPGVYAAIDTVAGPSRIYLIQFLTYPIEVCVILSHPLLYGLYMKKIRRRLPSWTACNCYRQWIIRRHNRVGVLRQQRRAATTAAAGTNTTV